MSCVMAAQLPLLHAEPLLPALTPSGGNAHTAEDSAWTSEPPRGTVHVRAHAECCAFDGFRQFIYLFILVGVVQGIEPRALHMIKDCFTVEQQLPALC